MTNDHPRRPFERPVAAAAAATGAIGLLLALTAPARALPLIPLAPVDDCRFTTAVQVLDQDDGLEVVFPSNGPTTIQGDASYSRPGQPGFTKGVANGTLTGNAIDIHVTWSGPFLFSHYTGQVNPDNSASGTVTNSNGNNATTGWHTKFSDRIKCKAAPAPPAPVPPAPVPPPAPAALTATVNADTDLYDKSNDNGDAHVIGMLRKGQVVTVVSACTRNAWCILTQPKGAAWGRDLTNN
ncbi:MAG: hypothetical protein ACXVX7_00635 [Mycobacterium sp.]